MLNGTKRVQHPCFVTYDRRFRPTRRRPTETRCRRHISPGSGSLSGVRSGCVFPLLSTTSQDPFSYCPGPTVNFLLSDGGCQAPPPVRPPERGVGSVVDPTNPLITNRFTPGFHQELSLNDWPPNFYFLHFRDVTVYLYSEKRSIECLNYWP